MSDIHDERLEAMLRSRRIESASPDLAQRIILQARQRPQNKTVSPWQWLRELCVEFPLPKPAYAVAPATDGTSTAESARSHRSPLSRKVSANSRCRRSGAKANGRRARRGAALTQHRAV